MSFNVESLYVKHETFYAHCTVKQLWPYALPNDNISPSPLSGAITCIIPWPRTRLGDRSFDVARPWLRNKLPASLRSYDSLCQFRRQLKAFLFVKD